MLSGAPACSGRQRSHGTPQPSTATHRECPIPCIYVYEYVYISYFFVCFCLFLLFWYFVSLTHLFVRADDVCVEGLNHQQRLAESAGALPQHFVRRHRDDGRERKDEAVDVLHEEVVGGDGVRD